MQPRLLLLFALSIPSSLAAQLRTAPTLKTAVGPISTVRLAIPTATATATALDAVQVTWTAVTNATEYRVFRGVDPNGPFVPIGVATGGQMSLQDAGLVPGTLFHYRIEATTSGQALTLTKARTEAAAPLAVLTTSASTPQAQAPTGLRRCATSSCLITWQAVPGALAYAVYEHYFALPSACLYGNQRTIYGTEAGSTGKGACSESYQVAAIFVMRDFPTPGAVLRVESPRATITP